MGADVGGGDLWLAWATAELFQILLSVSWLPWTSLSPLCFVSCLSFWLLVCSSASLGQLPLGRHAPGTWKLAAANRGVRATWAIMGTQHWCCHPMATAMHHFGSTPSPLSSCSKSTPAFLSPAKDSPRSCNFWPELLISHSDYETHHHDLLSLTQVCM